MLRERASDELQLPLDYLDKLSQSASHLYKRYTIPKRSGGLREIHHPAKELKALQRWLSSAVINRLPVHDAAYAYRRGRNIRDNALQHAQGRYLLRLDLSSFFPSITTADVERFIERNSASFLGWTSKDKGFFLKAVSLHGKLTIGAPSSPGLSNALMMQLDSRLSEISGARDVVYTRYADDMFFSSTTAGILGEVERLGVDAVRECDCPAGLMVNEKKRLHTSRKHRRQVTGLVLTPHGEVSIGREQKRSLRSRIHQWESLDEAERKSLSGHIAYCKSVEPTFVRRLILKYGHKVVEQVLSYAVP